MVRINVLKHQNLLDVSANHLGNIEGVYDIMLNNAKSITSKLNVNEELILLGSEEKNVSVINVYTKHQIKPATGNIAQQNEEYLAQEDGAAILTEDGQLISIF